MSDDSFSRTVVLICDHSEEGALGLVLNRPLRPDQVVGLPVPIGVHLGGPVDQKALSCLHTQADMADISTEILAGKLWFCASLDLILKALEEGSLNADAARLFVGYAGWGAGQLDEELEQGAWIIADPPTEAEKLFAGADLWQETLKVMGGEYAQMVHYPRDPSLN